jgi:hypothetical protein
MLIEERLEWRQSDTITVKMELHSIVPFFNLFTTSISEGG